MCRYSSRSATLRATVPFPAPDGPSIATIRRPGMRVPGVEATLLLSPRVNRRRKAAIAVLVPAALAAACAYAARDRARGASFVIQAANLQGLVRDVAELGTEPVSESPARVPWRAGQLAGRWYLPRSRSGRPVLIVPGVHAAGIEEPRLVAFARDVASMGHPVLTSQLPDLERYTLSTRTTDMIEDAAAWLADQPEHRAADGRIGIMGISFAGGLAIAASGRQPVRERVAFVMSFGGHGDLPRTLRYLCTGIQPTGDRRPPHDYGVAIILLGAADRIVPARQVEPLRGAILAFLEASHLDMVDKARAKLAFDRARDLAAALDEPARTLMGHVNDRRVDALGPILLPHIAAIVGDEALSPARAPAPAAAVYLLHGTDDNVIPAVESSLLAESLRARGVTVHHLATPLITHAEVDRSAALRAFWDLSGFWGRLLDE
jgi:dienelactone hydrolase